MAKQKAEKNPPRKDRVVYREFGEVPEVVEEVVEVPPRQQQVRVHLSKKGRGGKTVTVVSGLILPEEGLALFAKKLKAHCGSGGSVQEGTIEIQGDHAQKLLQWLTALEYKAKISGGG
jgi:translation initiation factor 1